MNKYGNKKAVRNGITFDSQKEAVRYDQLMLMLCAGEIRDLKLQPEFTLQEAFTTPLGERVRAIKYRADFAYERPTEPDCTGAVHWLPVVEDVKGFRTKEYDLKKKLMAGRGMYIRFHFSTPYISAHSLMPPAKLPLYLHHPLSPIKQKH